MVSLKYQSNFWSTLEMLLMKCEINLNPTWAANCFIVAGTEAINDRKRYVPIETLSSHDNAELLQQLKSGFKRTINWNKYQSKATIQRRN